MHFTFTSTHVAGAAIALACLAIGISEIKRGPMYGETRYGPWTFAFVFAAGAMLVLFLAHVLHVSRVTLEIQGALAACALISAAASRLLNSRRHPGGIPNRAYRKPGARR